ncbi:MAG TPA: NAD(P)/FAD-dependent oxidoreductase [Acidimicrobiales bacterium]|nr:NAD(P)/FAD-dependent oxidoreductase [Acidimicrobiales bacterium]
MSSESSKDVDVVIVGAGHNSLVCAAYLAEAGLRVTVLEAREIIGGNTVTEELTLPGWHHDSCSSAHVVIQSNPLLLNDELGLKETYGLQYLVTDPAVVFPIEGDDALIIHPDVEATAHEFERFSSHDAEALRDLMTEWDDGLKVAHAYFQAGLDLPDDEWSRRYEALRAKSAWDVVHELFEHPVIRRAVTWMSFATIQPPERVGTGALVPAIMAGRLKFGWSTPVGGSGALPSALRAHVEDHGGTVLTNAMVRRFVLEDGRCVGVETSDGRHFRAERAVVTSSHLQALPAAFDSPSAMIEGASAQWRPGLSVFAVHFALREHVTYQSASGTIQSVAGGLGTPEGLKRQVDAALEGRVDLESPWLLLVDSTVVDPHRAPGVTFKFLTIAPMLVDGHAWTNEDGSSYAQHLIDFARRFVNGLDDDNILMMRVESPTTLAEHNVANIGGSCHGGEFVNEDGSVFPGWTEFRTDVPGLYLTGSTSHPGGSVSGRPGRNTARVVLEDLDVDASSFMRRP